MEYHLHQPPQPPLDFRRWLVKNVKLSQLITILLIMLILVPLVTHYYLSKVDGISSNGAFAPSRDALGRHTMKVSDLRLHVDELYRIKSSVTAELVDLERQRSEKQSQITLYSNKLEGIHQDISVTEIELKKIKLQIMQLQKEKEEILERRENQIAPPKRILPSLEDNVILTAPQDKLQCRQHNCFDYSRCSLTSKFPVYFYQPSETFQSSINLNRVVLSTISELFSANPYTTTDPSIACIYIVLLGPTTTALNSKSDIESKLHSLPYWMGDGRNHVLLNLVNSVLQDNCLESINTGRAIIVQSGFRVSEFRHGFDILVPLLLGPKYHFSWTAIPPLVPAKRRYLATFQGELVASGGKHSTFHHMQSGKLKADLRGRETADQYINEELQRLQTITEDSFFIELFCGTSVITQGSMGAPEWALCGTEIDRSKFLRESTFSLVFSPDEVLVSSSLFYTRLYESLRYGAVPVIVGEHTQLPFYETLDWRKAVLFLPKPRITELYFYLQTVGHGDILNMRKQGRFIYETYFSSTKNIVDSILATIRTRLNIPSVVIRDEPSPSVFSDEFVPLKVDMQLQTLEFEDGGGGPVESPYSSPGFLRNYTFNTVNRHATWNELPGPFYMFPNTPFDPILPSEAKFRGSGVGFRPIGDGAGGAGKEFMESLGGNVPKEQFTIVMLTYEREEVLINSIQRLNGLPHLNKVLIVWNSPEPPSQDLGWPEIHVDVKVIQTKKNSLNNRFLPYDEIVTEAILSIDDDAHLRHDEILFGFRVWREARDRIVGFPGRFHAWDTNINNGWLYNSNYSCELSMVLTGAAFFHKYYAYLYTYWMPQEIRDMVDEYINCEDLAMNFLVSHITRQPPIKVTSRWTFRCPGCPQALSSDDSHFQERHQCMNFFTKVFGYMPLLYTQFRVDSVLFKTRLPHDKQKCFKFI
ncbi:exostosin-like 3 [Saccoglossus kowalevskii]|uniref:Exostosin-like 3-like n=1 Tax=Saccoglossus kowalevskii TaxID=10224 RepID=A0ABM0MM16_SACKO|nr:PREDICTED: exostosin-like 3-like [Saccoglossus kowalevskii]